MSYCLPEDEFFNPHEETDCDDDYGYPDTRRIDDLDRDVPPLPSFPMIWPEMNPVLQMMYSGYGTMTEALAKSQGLTILREPTTVDDADEIRRILLSFPRGFLDRLYADLHDTTMCRIDTARVAGRAYMAKLPKAKS